MSNFVLIMSDEHNPRFAAPYGHNVSITPNMQAMADDGVLFESAYCPSSLDLTPSFANYALSSTKTTELNSSSIASWKI